jgi:hypothetical protein
LLLSSFDQSRTEIKSKSAIVAKDDINVSFHAVLKGLREVDIYM